MVGVGVSCQKQVVRDTGRVVVNCAGSKVESQLSGIAWPSTETQLPSNLAPRHHTSTIHKRLIHALFYTVTRHLTLSINNSSRLTVIAATCRTTKSNLSGTVPEATVIL